MMGDTAPPIGCRKPVVLIYRDELLHSSETFIRAQAEALMEFEAHYVGSTRVPGLPLATERTHLVHGGGPFGRLRDLAFKATGFGSAHQPLARLRPALIHAHFGPDGVTAMPLARLLKCPLIVTFHGFDATVSDAFARRSFPRHRLYVRRRRELQRTAVAFLAVSDFVKGQLLAQGYRADRVTVHYTGVDIVRFSGDPEAPRERLVLFVGRLVEGKGCAYLLRAMAQVRRSDPSPRLVVIGDGPERGALEAQARELGLDVAFLGVRPPAEVRDWMSRAAMLCVPSITTPNGWREGFGMVFAEALASATPVVSSAVGGIPEAVGDGVGGLLVPEGDWPALAEAIRRMFADDELRVDLARRGQSRVRDLFDLRVQSTRLERIYRGVAGLPTPMAPAAAWSPSLVPARGRHAD